MKKLIILAMIATLSLSAMDIELGKKSKKLQKIKWQKKRNHDCRDAAIGAFCLTVVTMGPPFLLGTFVWYLNNVYN